MPQKHIVFWSTRMVVNEFPSILCTRVPANWGVFTEKSWDSRVAFESKASWYRFGFTSRCFQQSVLVLHWVGLPLKQLSPRWPSGKASASKAKDPGTEPRFPWSSHAITSDLVKLYSSILESREPGVTASVLGLTGLESSCYDFDLCLLIPCGTKGRNSTPPANSILAGPL